MEWNGIFKLPYPMIRKFKYSMGISRYFFLTGNCVKDATFELVISSGRQVVNEISDVTHHIRLFKGCIFLQ